MKAYRAANSEKLKAQDKALYESKREERIAKQKLYYSLNKDSVKIYKQKYRATNKAKLNYQSALYRANRLKATPPWADLKAIRAFYKKCPVGYEVDHIVPLKGKNVRGLHLLHNLQYLTISENRSKGNKHASNR